MPRVALEHRPIPERFRESLLELEQVRVRLNGSLWPYFIEELAPGIAFLVVLIFVAFVGAFLVATSPAEHANMSNSGPVLLVCIAVIAGVAVVCWLLYFPYSRRSIARRLDADIADAYRIALKGDEQEMRMHFLNAVSEIHKRSNRLVFANYILDPLSTNPLVSSYITQMNEFR